jgi:hypothetical protein
MILTLMTVLKIKSYVIYYDRFCTGELDSGLAGRFKKTGIIAEELRTSSDKKKKT